MQSSILLLLLLVIISLLCSPIIAYDASVNTPVAPSPPSAKDSSLPSATVAGEKTIPQQPSVVSDSDVAAVATPIKTDGGGGVGGVLFSDHHDRHRGHRHAALDPKTLVQHGSHTHTVAETERDTPMIFFILMVSIFGAQGGIWYWKKSHSYSFHRFSLAGLWILPFFYSLYYFFYRFLFFWLIYSIVSLLLIRRASAKPLTKTTPRLVYRYFHDCYRISYGLFVVGYFCFVSDIMGISYLFFPFLYPLSPTGLLLMFYGLYFGVLNRDLAYQASENLSNNLGYSAKKDGGLPQRQLADGICAICDLPLKAEHNETPPPQSAFARALAESKAEGKGAGLPLAESVEKYANAPVVNERVYELPCKHVFHEMCLRGWTLVGKRDHCPYCVEKVGKLRDIFVHPWETQNVAWSVLLDALRYLIVFNPIILIAAQYLLQWLY